MNGSASSSVTKIARIFGTKISVCSWIWVSACTSETTTPTIRPTTISGDDTTTMVQIASRAISRVSAPVMIYVPFHNSSFRDAPPGAGPDDRLDRHLHDVFIGLDHAVAHRHQRGHRDVGFG